MDGEVAQESSPSPPLNPMDAFLNDLPVAELTSDEMIHGAVSEFYLPTLSSPLLLLGSTPEDRHCGNVPQSPSRGFGRSQEMVWE